MANIKQIMQCEPGWEGVYIRDDAWADTPIKTTSAPIVGWALLDDENGESSVQALLSVAGSITLSGDMGPRYFGAARPGDYAARLADFWEAAAQSYIEEHGEPGAEQDGEGEEGDESGEGASTDGAPSATAEGAKAG